MLAKAKISQRKPEPASCNTDAENDKHNASGSESIFFQLLRLRKIFVALNHVLTQNYRIASDFG